MRNVSAMLVFVGILGCSNDGEAGPQPQDSLDEEIASFLDVYLTAVDTRDAALLQTLHAEGDRFQWIEDGEVRYRIWAAAKKNEKAKKG